MCIRDRHITATKQRSRVGSDECYHNATSCASFKDQRSRRVGGEAGSVVGDQGRKGEGVEEEEGVFGGLVDVGEGEVGC